MTFSRPIFYHTPQRRKRQKTFLPPEAKEDSLTAKSRITVYRIGGRVTVKTGGRSETRLMTAGEKKQFRSDIATLQKQGLLPGKKIKTSTATPGQIKGGRPLYEYLRQYKDVLTGNAAAVKLPKSAIIEQHKMGRKTVAGTGAIGGRVLIPKAPDERVVVTETGAVHRVDIRSGVRVVEIPGPFLNKSQRQRAIEVANEIGGKKYWGYKLRGNRGTQYFETPRQLFNFLRRQYRPQFARSPSFHDFFYDRISIITSNNWHTLVHEEGK